MSEKFKAKIFFFIYNVLWLFICIPFLLTLLWRYRHYDQHRSRFWERLSIYNPPPKECIVWVHVASVGEAIGCMPLLTALKKKYGSEQLLVTTTTPTGESIVRQYLGENVCHAYLPFDFVFFMRRFLAKIKPKVLLIFETEVWPSMVSSCYENKVDTILINARMSEKSKGRYDRFSYFSRQIFNRLTFVVAQSSNDASRLQSLGANNIAVLGSIKLDVTLNEKIISDSKKLRLNWQGAYGQKNIARKILLAASTHNGEEEIVLKAYRDIKKYHPEALLLLVPRHSERFDQVERLCIRESFIVVKRSAGETVSSQTDIVLVDTMGELLMLLGISDVVIMGGTFVDRGGHNFLEPAIWGIPIVSGRSYYNFSGVAQGLMNVEALMPVDTPEELSLQIKILLENDKLRFQKGSAAKQYIQGRQGSLKKLLLIIEPYLDT
jgi:3-deoxy-D-manno-octulosonic-acid transferase